MTNEEAVQSIKNLLDYYLRNKEYSYYEVEFREIPKEEIKAVEMAIVALRNQPRWIPCEKRLPENVKKHYWVCTDTGYQCECRWTNVNHFWTELTTKWHWHIMDTPQYSKVVAWMSLPEPYKGGENNE